ncbi:MAG: LEA type 2 family protein [Gemmatimonadota bacterium]
MNPFLYRPWVAVAVLLTACATLEALGIQPLRFDQADDRSSELRILAPSAGRPLGGAAIRLWAEIENPNGFGLTLTEVAGDLLLEDAEAIAVDFPLGLPLAARQDTVIPLDVSIGFDDLPRLGQVARAAIGGGPLDYRLDGTFAVEAGRLGRPRFGPLTLLQGEIRVR